MIKGTTAQFRFKLPCNFGEIQTLKITFWQNGYYGPSENRVLPIIKTQEHCSVLHTDKDVSVKLSVEETLRFTEFRKAYVQLQAIALDGTGYATKEIPITVYPIKDDSYVGDDIVPPTTDYDGVVILDGLSIAEEDGEQL